MKKILSTKKLLSDQRRILANAHIEVSHYNAIRIVPQAFTLPKELKYTLFTSQHTVALFLKKKKELNGKIRGIKAFCVGEKTAQMLEKNGIEVLHFESYASDLAAFIIRHYAHLHFDFFCGSKRRDTLPLALEKYRISFRETQLYHTQEVPVYWQDRFDAILFFSPSGVQSFLRKNKPTPQCLAICIGHTTGEEALGFFPADCIKIAQKTSVESVLSRTKELIEPLKKSND